MYSSHSDTVKLTDVPLCVSVTVPNVAGVVHPPEIWHDVKVNVSA